MCSVCNGGSCWVLASTLLQALACMVFTCGMSCVLQMIYYYYTSPSVKRSVIYGRKVRRLFSSKQCT
jgi:hypothetical protein